MSKMITKLIHKFVAFIKNLGRRKEDVSWKEISGMVKEDRLNK